MKKLIAMLLALIMVLSLVACGDKAKTSADAPATDVPEADTSEEDENTSEVELTEAEGDVEVVTYFCTVGAYSELLFSEIDKWNQTTGKEKGVYIDITHNINDGSVAIEMQMQAGNHWDIMQGCNTESWYLQGWTMDLQTIDNPEVQALIDSYRDLMFPGFCLRPDGAITTVPLEVTPIKMAVNRRLFEENSLEYPKTWDDVVHCAQVITENSNGEAWGFGGTTWSAYIRRLVFKECASSTETFYWDPNTGTYSFDQYEIPITALKTMYENGWMLGLDDLAIDPIRAEFAAGRVAMFPAPAYDWSVYTNQFPCVDEFDFIDPPTYTGEALYNNLSNYVGNVGISKVNYEAASDAKKKAIEEAWLFICGDELNKIIYANAGIIPAKASIMEGVDLVIADNAEQWAQMSDLTNYTLVCPRPDAILPLEGDKFQDVFLAYIHGDVEWDEAVADLEERYNAAYQAAKEDPDIDTAAYEFEWSHHKG